MRLPRKKLPLLSNTSKVGYFGLYRYATWLERCAVLLAVGLCLLGSTALMGSIIIYGELTSLMLLRSTLNTTQTSGTNYILALFGGDQPAANNTYEARMDSLVDDSIAYVIASFVIMALQFATAAVSVHLMMWSAQRQISRIRYKFLESVLKQDMSWFDTETTLNFASTITNDLEKLKDGIGEQVAMFSHLVGCVLMCCSVCFAYGWQLTLAGLAVIPFSIAVATLVSKFQTKSSNRELEAYSHAGRIVEEVLSGIRTVVAFGGEEKEVKRYKERLEPAEKCGKLRGLITGFGSGFSWLMTYTLNCVVFVYGTRLIVRDMVLPPADQEYHPGIMVTILFGIFQAAQSIALCGSYTETFAAAKGAAQGIFPVLERKTKIDGIHTSGVKPTRFNGDIKLDNVHFSYPSRPGVKVLKGLSLHVKAGETVALVGGSGCGKSTVLQLLQRLYEPDAGWLELDGHRLPDLDLHYLRTSIGVVGQEPVLFSGTIRDNIALGKENATFEEITAAAKRAFAHDFIQNLADGYNTVIGERGAQLSGGQKQRIAIARSLIREPSVLLLDEATSALDVHSERKVQAALDAASHGRTTLMVSHRLSTIVNATRIIYLDQGKVAEDGSHEELMDKKGLYYKLVQNDAENRKIAVLPDSTLTHDEHPEESLDNPNNLRRSSIMISQRESLTPERRLQKRNSLASMKSNGPVLHSAIAQPEEDLDDDMNQHQEEEVEASDLEVLKLNAPEWPYILTGCIASLFVGATMPIFAILFSEVYGMFASLDEEEIIYKSQLYSGLFIVLALICGFATFGQTFVFNIAGLKLTTRLRIQTFSSFLRQEMSWFDQQANSVGALCARLSSDAAAVQGATGTRIGTILQGISTMVIGVILAMGYSWKMSLVSMISLPVVMGGIYLEGHMMKESQRKQKKAMESASKIATEGIMNIRTVQSMGIERRILARYAAALEVANKAGGLASRLRGTVYGVCICAPSLGYGVSLAYGGILVAREALPYKTAVLVSEALIYGAWMMGQALSQAPNFSSAKQSGARILNLISRTPAVSNHPDSKDDHTWQSKGEIQYKSVSFRYPTRPNVPVLQSLNLRLEPGKSVALVGHSGCGKSTCLQLLQRFYDPKTGSVELDGKSIQKDLTLERLRSQLGIVQQEPVLFDTSIRENISYGDNSRRVSDEEIFQAAKLANIHSFIIGLPSGYDTRLGSAGAQLSGGQKQRIAIARALVRNPRVLLLDEATSALDTTSEKVVQAALDEASRGRTTIIIAHRLQTVQNADTICVIDNGKVAEKGSHSELLNRRGLYYDLYRTQNNSN